MKNRTLLGMILFVASESIFFLLLVLAYVNFHKSTGPTAAAMLDPLKTGLFSLALFSSSFTMWLAEMSRKKELLSQRRQGGEQPSQPQRKSRGGGEGTEADGAHIKSAWVRLWLLITIVLGATFLAGQGLEYAHLLTHDVTISRDLFGSTFFTLTGFHGFHVLVGLILLSTLLGLAFLGRKKEPSLGGIQAIAIYWHFVDAVWVVIFSIVYLWRYV